MWYPGNKVKAICKWEDHSELEEGRIYTLKEIYNIDNHILISLKEIKENHNGYYAWRFEKQFDLPSAILDGDL